MRTTARERYEVISRLEKLGIAYEDANQLRRISLTLRRWFELECGDGNDYGSWAIERDEEDYALCTQCKHRWYGETALTHSCPNCGDPAPIRHKGSDVPYMVHHHYRHGQGKDHTERIKIPDREAGARKRLAKIIERYPQLTYYVQTDPRGASLYILRTDDVKDYPIEQIYNRGVAVY